MEKMLIQKMMDAVSDLMDKKLENFMKVSDLNILEEKIEEIRKEKHFFTELSNGGKQQAKQKY